MEASVRQSGMGRGRSCAPPICGIAVGRGRPARPTGPRALSKLDANWRGIAEGAAYDREIKGRSKGQAELALEGNER